MSKEPVPYDDKKTDLAFWSGMLRRLQLTWLLFWDKDVSLMAKMVIPAALLYLVSPVDFIPAAMFPVVGGLDDLGVVLLGIALFIKLAPQDIVQHYLDQMEYGSDDFDDDGVVDTTYSVVDDE